MKDKKEFESCIYRNVQFALKDYVVTKNSLMKNIMIKNEALEVVEEEKRKGTSNSALEEAYQETIRSVERFGEQLRGAHYFLVEMYKVYIAEFPTTPMLSKKYRYFLEGLLAGGF